LIHPKRYFPKSVRPVSCVKIRKPFDFGKTKHAIDQRRLTNGWNIPSEFEEEIYRLSGGIPGLIKRLCSFVDTYKSLDKKEVLEYPPVEMVLEELVDLFAYFPKSKLQLLGLLDSKGNTISPLLEQAYLGSLSRKCLESSPLLNQVFEYFKEREEDLVSLYEISDLVQRGEFSLWGTYKLIERLKKKLPSNYRLKNVKGKGYILQKA